MNREEMFRFCFDLKQCGVNEKDIRDFLEVSELYLQWRYNWVHEFVHDRQGEYKNYCLEQSNKYQDMQSEILSAIISKHPDVYKFIVR